MGSWNVDSINFVSTIDKKLTVVSGDPLETSYLFQRISVAIQRVNNVSFAGTLSNFDCWGSHDPTFQNSYFNMIILRYCSRRDAMEIVHIEVAVNCVVVTLTTIGVVSSSYDRTKCCGEPQN